MPRDGINSTFVLCCACIEAILGYHKWCRGMVYVLHALRRHQGNTSDAEGWYTFNVGVVFYTRRAASGYHKFTRVERHQGSFGLLRVPSNSFDFFWFYMMSYDCLWYHLISYDFTWFSLIIFDFLWYSPSHEGHLSYNHGFSASSASMHLLRFEGSLSDNRDVLHTQPSAPYPLQMTCPHPLLMASIFLFTFYLRFFFGRSFTRIWEHLRGLEKQMDFFFAEHRGM